jgi:hypothetical protein
MLPTLAADNHQQPFGKQQINPNHQQPNHPNGYRS